MKRGMWWIVGLMGLAALVLLPLAAHWLRRHKESGCALDGSRIDLIYRVEIVDREGEAHEFCCVRCAQIWRDQHAEAPQAVAVTDEASGQMIDADAAIYVRSSVVTTPATRNRIHAFRDRADAQKHAAAFGGIILTGSERPLP
jgi:hypothetical protein